MAGLVLFAAAAGTGVIAPDLFLHSHRPGYTVFAGTLAQYVGALFLETLFAALRLMGFMDLFRLLDGNIGTHQEGNNFLVYPLNQGFEEGERLKFVNQQRILLFIGC